mgnify:CR=1 FL=1
MINWSRRIIGTSPGTEMAKPIPGRSGHKKRPEIRPLRALQATCSMQAVRLELSGLGCFSSSLHHYVERSGIAESQLCQGFSIHLDAGLVGQIHKSGVGQTALSYCSVDSLNPERAHVSFFATTVIEGVEASLHDGNTGESVKTVATSAVAFRLFHQTFSAVLMKCAVFSSHDSLPVQFPFGSKLRISLRSASAT